MGTLTKKQLIEKISARTRIPRTETRLVVQEFLDQIILELKRGHRVEFRDFGVFEVRIRGERTAQNPKTLAQVRVPARRAVRFKMGRLMRESVATEPKPAPDARADHAPTPDVVTVGTRAGKSRV
ncbi:MAG: integration host factor subunit beta [Phycisphaerae bacterium]|nr:integration host factor subunit beta [Phycisphaerae bacterium]